MKVCHAGRKFKNVQEKNLAKFTRHTLEKPGIQRVNILFLFDIPLLWFYFLKPDKRMIQRLDRCSCSIDLFSRPLTLTGYDGLMANWDWGDLFSTY